MFAVLRHSGPGGVHWDFLIELPGQERLATWRLDRDPTGVDETAAAKRIIDHRRDYLEYEGEISGGRGYVRRIDRGECDVLERDERMIVMRLDGRLLRGTFTIGASPDDADAQPSLRFRRMREG